MARSGVWRGPQDPDSQDSRSQKTSGDEGFWRFPQFLPEMASFWEGPFRAWAQFLSSERFPLPSAAQFLRTAVDSTRIDHFSDTFETLFGHFSSDLAKSRSKVIRVRRGLKSARGSGKSGKIPRTFSNPYYFTS